MVGGAIKPSRLSSASASESLGVSATHFVIDINRSLIYTIRLSHRLLLRTRMRKVVCYNCNVAMTKC